MSFDWVQGSESGGEVQWGGGTAQVPEKSAICEGSIEAGGEMLGSSERSFQDLSDDPRHDPKGSRGGEISWDQWGRVGVGRVWVAGKKAKLKDKKWCTRKEKYTVGKVSKRPLRRSLERAERMGGRVVNWGTLWGDMGPPSQ